jgi:hypothetical protein
VTLKVEQFVRRSFPVDGVRVTVENFEEAAEWCNGDIRQDDDGTKYIQVRVQTPLTARQTKAYVGDWLLYAGRGYKVYMDRAFRKSFDIPRDEGRNVFEGSQLMAPGAVSHSGSGNPGGTTHVQC